MRGTPARGGGILGQQVVLPGVGIHHLDQAPPHRMRPGVAPVLELAVFSHGTALHFLYDCWEPDTHQRVTPPDARARPVAAHIGGN